MADIDVANLALGHLRQRSIASFDEQTLAAVQCRRYYQQAIDGTLRAFDWPFARAYAVGVPFPGVTLPGWRYAFSYPDGCLAIRELARARQLDPIKRYRIATVSGVPLVFANEPAITFIYTQRPASTDDFDPEYRLALSYHLAMLLAMPLTGKIEMTDNMRKLAASAVAQAEADAGNEDTNDVGEEPVPDWLAVRGVSSLLRDDRACGEYDNDGFGFQAAGAFILPGSQTPVVPPPMVTALADQVKPAYIPGLTAAVPPPEPILGSDDFEVSVDGGLEGG